MAFAPQRVIAFGDEVSYLSADGRKYGGYFEVEGVAGTGHTVEQIEAALAAEVKKLQEQAVDDKELQKVKNQALATKYRRLDGNFLIMVQLLVYDVLGSWQDTNTETSQYLAVTAADVQRVAKKYLQDSMRNVAVYRTKAKDGDDAAGGGAPEDAAFAALPPDQQAAAKQMKAQFGAIPDAAALEQILGKVNEQMAAAPAEQQAFGKWLIGYLESRIAALKGGK